MLTIRESWASAPEIFEKAIVHCVYASKLFWTYTHSIYFSPLAVLGDKFRNIPHSDRSLPVAPMAIKTLAHGLFYCSFYKMKYNITVLFKFRNIVEHLESIFMMIRIQRPIFKLANLVTYKTTFQIMPNYL